MDWAGGVDFLRLTVAMLRAGDPDVELHLLLPVRGPLAMARSVILRSRKLAQRLRGQSVPSYGPALASIVEVLRGAGGLLYVHRIDRGDRALARICRRLGLDVLLPSFEPLPFGPDQPWVGYLYDFQHKYLQHLFTPDECTRRDAAMARMLATAPAVIVNARSVAQDVIRFHPQARARVHSLPFAAAPDPAWFALDVAAAQRRYGVSGPYFIVCNQFWAHKDHGTAFEALARLGARHPDVRLVCTGATSDHRDPQWFPSLMRRADELGIGHRLFVLGLVPKDDQIALMRGAVALIQPTLFEGGPGGGAVYDAVSVGTPCIVSDIEVNRELDEPGVELFTARDADALARAMANALERRGVARLSADALIARGRERRLAGASRLSEAIASVRAAG
jgi:glycosyltransferase involved in cell wall biosynthesis